MELRQLNYFVKAAETLSFTEASHISFVTQSALSQQIKNLELELGVLLFNRIGKKIQLTEAGSLFLKKTRHTLKSAEIAKQQIVDLQNLKIGTLYIGVTYGLTDLFTKALISFSEKYPLVKVNISYGTSEELLGKLKLNALDFILSFQDITDEKTITTIPLFESFLVMVIHNSHPLANTTQINLKKLSTLKLVLTDKGFTARKVLDIALNKHKLPSNNQIELNHVPTILKLIESGKWATILTKYTTEHLPSLKKISIQNNKLKLNAGIRYLKGNYQKKAAKVFCQLIFDEIKEKTKSFD